MTRTSAFALAMVLLTGGCVASKASKISEAMDSWVGAHKSQLFMKWGPPTRTASDGKDGEILTYEYDKTGTKIKPDLWTTLGLKSGGHDVGKTGNIAKRLFWVNSEGKIYHWKWEGI